MLRQQHQFPPMPEVGHPEGYYARKVAEAERSGDVFAREAAKVGQYVTLATAGDLEWPAKLRYFQHALRRHCNPPPIPDDDVWLFYRTLADFVRRYAGQEALRIASREDDEYVALQKKRLDPNRIRDRAVEFFAALMGKDDKRLEWFMEEDWVQLRLIRAQWI